MHVKAPGGPEQVNQQLAEGNFGQGALKHRFANAANRGLELIETLFSIEESLKPLTVMLWYELIQHVGDVSDHSESVGDRLRLLIAR